MERGEVGGFRRDKEFPCTLLLFCTADRNKCPPPTNTRSNQSQKRRKLQKYVNFDIGGKRNEGHRNRKKD